MLSIIEKVLSEHGVQQFRRHLDNAEWISGQSTAGSLSAAVKFNHQLGEESSVAVSLGNHILRILGNHAQFISAAIPEKIYPPKFNRYTGGEHYGVHVDGAMMQVAGTKIVIRSDISATLFLCEPDEYEGGELMIEGSFGMQEVKLTAGNMVLYPSTTLHQVLPVTKGTRTCSFFWVQSMIQDTGQRTLLYDLDQSIQALSRAREKNDKDIIRLTSVYHNLMRRWATV